MRMVFVIVCMAAIASGLVYIRSSETRVRHQVLALQNYQQLQAPRLLWQQRAELSRLTAPQEVQRRCDTMGLLLINSNQKTGLAAKNETPPSRRR